MMRSIHIVNVSKCIYSDCSTNLNKPTFEKHFFNILRFNKQMKKLLSISLALLMLLSGMQLTISMHYCGGELADSKVSVTGHLASCGMETETDNCTSANTIEETDCCRNKVSIYLVDQNYSPSYSEFKIFSQSVLQIFSLPENNSFHSIFATNTISTDVSPPENKLVHAVSLPKICVFLI